MSKRILVVDDDPYIHDFCRTVLEKAGYEVVTALSAKEGQELVASKHPDLVVLDVMMEAADAGFEMATWLAGSYAGTPVIMLSSIADAANQVFDTSSLPVADLVNKPIAPKELLRKVEELLARASKPG